MADSYLIVRLGSLGDLVHTLPAVRALRRAQPQARLGWLVEREHLELVRMFGAVDRIHTVDTFGWRRAFASPSTWRAIRAAQQELRQANYAAALDFQGLFKSSLWPWLAGIPLRIGFAAANRREPLSTLGSNRRVPIPRQARHVIEKNLELLRAVGVVERSARFDVEAPPESCAAWRQRQRRLGIERYLILNPGGGWPTKRWHPERFAALGLRLLASYPGHLIWTGGPMDRELLERIQSQIGSERNLAAPLELDELWAAIAGAELFIGGDTGPLHFAVALGTPVVGIYGPTDPARNGPLDPHDTVIWHQLWCSRCYRRRCPYRWECMESIGVDEVLDVIRLRLGSTTIHESS